MLIVRHLSRALPIAALLLAAPAAARAQRPDSARVAPPVRRADTATVISVLDTAVGRFTPPLSPRRAFVYSLIAPGYAQTVLGRPTATAVFVLAEAVAAVMIFESSAGLREARRIARDTVFLGTDPQTGLPVTGPTDFPRSLVRSRQAQVEDWLAILLANHLFAAADAYVAAHLWDVPARVSPRVESRQIRVGAEVRF